MSRTVQQIKNAAPWVKIAEGYPSNLYGALGLDENLVQFIVIGETTLPNKDIEYVIWDEASTFTPPTSAGPLIITSSTSSDASGNTGANIIYIEGIDANKQLQSATYTMNGTSPAISGSALQWFGVNRMVVASAGNSKTNNGIITATLNGNMVSNMPASTSISSQTLFFVPGDMDCYVVGYTFNAGGGNGMEFYFKPYSISPSGVKIKYFTLNVNTDTDRIIERHPDNPYHLPAGSIFYITAQSNGLNGFVEATVHVNLVKNV